MVNVEATPAQWFEPLTQQLAPVSSTDIDEPVYIDMGSTNTINPNTYSKVLVRSKTPCGLTSAPVTVKLNEQSAAPGLLPELLITLAVKLLKFIEPRKFLSLMVESK